MKIFLSNQGNLRNFQQFVSRLDLSHPEFLEVSTHKKWITAHPANIALTAALALKVGRENAKMVGSVPESGLYLDRIGLYDFLSTKSPFEYKRKEAAGRFVPISVIRTSEEQTRFIADMIPLLHVSERSARIIKYVLGELIRNVLEHSFSKQGAIVVAQYYRKTNRVSIAICDTGIGVWRSMNGVWHPRTDLEALRLALSPGITGTTRMEGGTSENAGAGLFYVKSLAKIARNYFAIYSGSAEYTLLKTRSDLKKTTLYADPFDDHHTAINDAPRFDGTLVAVDIKMDETGEFTDLLDLIGMVYDDAIRERKRNKFREPNFI